MITNSPQSCYRSGKDSSITVPLIVTINDLNMYLCIAVLMSRWLHGNSLMLTSKARFRAPPPPRDLTSSHSRFNFLLFLSFPSLHLSPLFHLSLLSFSFHCRVCESWASSHADCTAGSSATQGFALFSTNFDLKQLAQRFRSSVRDTTR